MQISEEDVDHKKPEALTLYDYPPRVIFQMTPTVNSQPCTFQLDVTGMTRDVDFQFPLRGTKHCVGKNRGRFAVSSTTVYCEYGSNSYREHDSNCLFPTFK